MKPMSYQGDEKDIAVINGKNIEISRKVGREVAVFIKGKTVEKAISDLEKVIKKELVIPYKKYKLSVPHRRGDKVATGRYPANASMLIINLLNGLRTNAEAKGLNTSALTIVHAACQHGPIAWRYGRQRRRRRKLAHFEIVAKETEKKKEERKKTVVEKVKEKLASKAKPDVKKGENK